MMDEKVYKRKADLEIDEDTLMKFLSRTWAFEMTFRFYIFIISSNGSIKFPLMVT